MQKKASISKIISFFLSVVFLIMLISPVANSAVQNFSGDFIFYESSIGTHYVDVPFTINTHSVASFSYDSLCSNPDNLTILIRSADFTGDAMSIGFARGVGENSSPIEGYPLHQGNYVARLLCNRTIIKQPPDPEWNLTVATNAISISFQQDQEPASEIPETLNSTKSYSGWLGLWGTPGKVTSVSNGKDYYDTHFYNMKKGTKIKFKIEWGDFSTSTNTDIDFAVLLYRFRDGKTYFVHSFANLENSGDMTEEITLLEDGVYQVSFGGAAVGFNDDKKRYGGYKATVILNGEQVPNVKIVGVHKISTQYWSDDLRRYVTVEDLVPGEKSNVDILIENYDPQFVPVTLVYGLSVRNGPITPVGSAKLNIAPSGGIAVYNTTLLTPANTPLALTGNLVVVLYGSANEVLDTFTTKVGIYSPEHAPIIVPILQLLLMGTFNNLNN